MQGTQHTQQTATLAALNQTTYM